VHVSLCETVRVVILSCCTYSMCAAHLINKWVLRGCYILLFFVHLNVHIPVVSWLLQWMISAWTLRVLHRICFSRRPHISAYLKDDAALSEKNTNSSSPLRFVASFAVNPRENLYKLLLLRNYSNSLATFLSLTIKAHVHSVTQGQLWKPQHRPTYVTQACALYFRNLRRHSIAKSVNSSTSNFQPPYSGLSTCSLDDHWSALKRGCLAAPEPPSTILDDTN